MPNYMSLEQVREIIADGIVSAYDDVIPIGRLRMENGRVVVSDQTSSGFPLTPWAQSQLCTRLNIPVQYYRRCPDEIRDLQVNYWLDQYKANDDLYNESQWKLRINQNNIRAIVSPRYAPTDNMDLIRVIEPHITPNMKVVASELNEESFHLRIVDLHGRQEVRVGDEIYSGLHIANSEVGKRAVSIDAVVFRLVCSNGMIRLIKGHSVFKRRHIGICGVDLLENAGEAIRLAIAESNTAVNLLRLSQRIPIKNMDTEIESLANRYNFPKAFSEMLRTNLAKEQSVYQETKYGLLNALTYSAQSLDPDGRYEIERIAGTLLGDAG